MREIFQNGEWKDTFTACYVIQVSERSECWNCTKNIQNLYLDRTPALRTVKKWFGRFRNGDFNMDNQLRSGRPSAIDDDIVSA